MGNLASRMIGGLLAVAVGTALVGWVASGAFFDQIRPDRDRIAQANKHDRSERRVHAPRREKRRVKTPGERARELVERRAELPREAAGVVWRAVRAPLSVLALLCASLTVARLIARRRRSYRRFRLKPFRSDEATPDQVQRFLESLHQIVLRRWWQRLFLGQPSVALEFHAVEGRTGRRLRFALVCEDRPGLAEAIDGRLCACYADARIEPAKGELPWAGAILRLKKRKPFIKRLKTVDRYEKSLVDALANTLVRAGGPCSVQYVVTPTPAAFDRFGRWLFRAEEREQEAARVKSEGKDPGTRSEVVGQELAGGLDVQHRPLFFAEIRVAADDLRAARSVAGTLRGESRAENQLVERHAIIRRRLYAVRLRRATGNPLPSWHRGVLSSTELAALWHLPSPFLKAIQLERSSVPRVPAPAETHRPQNGSGTLLRDQHGPVGIHTRDKRMNAMLLGTQGTGKTSVMCRGVADDAADPNCAVIVLDGKSDLALKALSVIPEDIGPGRAVHYLDFANPEIGIDPFSADADRDAVADGIVEAFKDVHEEGSIQASSDRYLRQAAIACMAWCEKTGQGPATLWDMWTMLLPSAEGFRKEVVRTIGTDTELAAPAMFFGEQLPDQLHSARGQFVPRLDSPVNKLQKLTGQPKLDAILRHPVSLSIDDVIRNREVLVVSGSVGAFGEGSAKVLLQFILHMVHRALIRQQALPEEDRARVALKVDEAHLLFSGTFTRMLAMDRSAGLECTAAWQSLGQIEDKDLRSIVLNLLRHRFIFSLADQDAREMTPLFQTAFADVVRDDSASRARQRITPDTLINLPNFHCACSWIAGGRRMDSFVAQTLPMEQDDGRIEAHLENQRERGAHYPGALPPPDRLADYLQVREYLPRENGDRLSEKKDARPGIPQRPSKSGNGSAQASGDGAAAPTASKLPDFAPEKSSLDDSGDKVGIARLGADVGRPLPDAYTELDIEEITGLRWEVVPEGHHKPPLPRKSDIEILAALFELRFLLASQIGRRFLSDKSLRSVRHRLNLMFKVGWIRRCEITTKNRGHNQRVYSLGAAGFELLQAHRGRTELARNVDPDARWRDPEVEDPRLVIHDLHANAWLFALERMLRPEVVRGWRGPRSSVLEPPRERVRNQWVKLAPERVSLGTGQHLADLQLDEFQPVKPDLSVELDLSLEGNTRRVELLVEMDRSRRASANLEKFRRYDALLTGWALSLPRYKLFGEPPIVVFVVEDDEKALQFLKAADAAVTGRIGKWGVPEGQWPAHGRRRLFVVAERDIHQRTLRAQRLPEHPPELRASLSGKRTAKLAPEQIASLIPRPFLRLPRP